MQTVLCLIFKTFFQHTPCPVSTDTNPQPQPKKSCCCFFLHHWLLLFSLLFLFVPIMWERPRVSPWFSCLLPVTPLENLIQSTYSSDSQMCIFSSNPSAEPQTYIHSYLFCSSIWMSNKHFTLIYPTLNSRFFPCSIPPTCCTTGLPVSQLMTPPSFQLLKTSLHVTPDFRCPHSVHQIILLATRNPPRKLYNSPVHSLNTLIFAALVQALLFLTGATQWPPTWSLCF